VRRHLFWAVVALALALAAHAAFALYVPGWWFSRQLERLALAHGWNSFFVMAPEQQADLFPGLPRAGVAGLCLFDVSQSDVSFTASLPPGPWVASIYTSHAEPIYAVNNRQSGTDTFSLRLSLAPGLIDQILGAAPKDSLEDLASGWTVMPPEPRGLAVLWFPAAEAGVRAAAAEVIGRSRCAPLTGGAAAQQYSISPRRPLRDEPLRIAGKRSARSYSRSTLTPVNITTSPQRPPAAATAGFTRSVGNAITAHSVESRMSCFPACLLRLRKLAPAWLNFS
jgi:uncharacterized membrane protein